MTTVRRRLLACLALVGCVTAATVPSPAGADTKPPPGVPPTLTADPLPTWQTDGVVWSLAVVGDVIYAGGNFDHIRPPDTDPGDPREQPRHNLAAFNAATGALTGWAPTADRSVHAMVPSPDGTRIVLGGDFNRINGNPPHGLGAVRTDSTGTSAPWETGVEHRSDQRRSWVTDLVTDGQAIYASANGENTFDGRLALNPDDGTLRWIDHCLGATQALTILDGILYSGSHAHDCSSQPGGFPDIVPDHPYQRLLAEPADPDPAQFDTPPILHWFPTTNGGPTSYNQGPRALDNDGRYLWVGGDFTTVNWQPQQGLTRFGSLTVANDTNAPEPVRKPTVTKPDNTTGTLTVTWTQTWDRDNAELTYQLIRDDNTVIHTLSETSTFWNLKTRTYTDTGLVPGSTHTYSVRAIDPFDNRYRSARSNPTQAS